MAATTTAAATITTALMVVAMVLLTLPENTMAQSPPMLAPGMAPGPAVEAGAPGPSVDCFSVLLNMSDCLSFVEVGSNLTKPETACCPELAGLVESNPICLCQLLGDPDKAGITVDLSKALKLPSACGISTPPVSVCAAIGIPVSVPTASPAGSPEALASSPEGGKDNNGGGRIEASFMCFLGSLATVIFISFF